LHGHFDSHGSHSDPDLDTYGYVDGDPNLFSDGHGDADLHEDLDRDFDSHKNADFYGDIDFFAVS